MSINMAWTMTEQQSYCQKYLEKVRQSYIYKKRLPKMVTVA